MYKTTLLQIIYAAYILLAIVTAFGCNNNEALDERLDRAELFMETRPDSSLCILDAIVETDIKGSRRKARYALLMSMALDKNYIDTTTFDVLQPAINYYSKHGSADERLRTYYYEGRIYRNSGAEDLAMRSYLNLNEIKGHISDSLTLARLLVAQSILYYKQYNIRDFISNNLKAAKIFESIGRLPEQIRCYGKVIDGEIILNNDRDADSIVNICKMEINNCQELKIQVLRSFLRYSVAFGSDEDIMETMNEVEKAGIADDVRMTLARAYSKIGDSKTGLHYLTEASVRANDIFDSLTYWSVKTEILENLGEDRKALDAFRNYSRLLEEYHLQLFSNELLFSEKKHEMEIENMAKIQKRDNLIKWVLVGTVILIVIILLVYHRYRINKAGRLIAEGDAERLQLETEKLQLEGDNQRLLNDKLKSESQELQLRSEKLQLEKDNLQLEADNMRLEIGQLEDERERLTVLLERRPGLTEETMRIIRSRLEMLNGLLAKEITNEDSYARQFRKYVDVIKKDKKKFQKSLRKDLQATYPEFFSYLENHGLTEREIDYVCLYAIGLRGKEIGNYLELARHYNISTDIRRKLGLDSNGFNLGPFIRKMMTGQGL